MGDPSEIKVLNEADAGEAQNVVVKGEVLAAKLKDTMMDLRSNYINDSGKVNYPELVRSDVFKECCRFSAQLKFVDFEGDLESESERRAFFINVYNCLTLHALAVQPELPASPKNVKDMWNSNAYNVGGMILTLDDIEHGVLRENRGHPVKQSPHFGAGDPRAMLVLRLDPRIHFALNCGANSCPPIKVYSGKRLENQLRMAAASFNSKPAVDRSKKKVSLSKLYLWYRKDFGASDKEVLESLASYISDGDGAVEVRHAIRENYSIDYLDYDWGLNAE